MIILAQVRGKFVAKVRSSEVRGRVGEELLENSTESFEVDARVCTCVPSGGCVWL